MSYTRPWDDDVEKVRGWLEHQGQLHRPSPTALGDALRSAWHYGYTAGMAEAAQAEQQLSEEADR